MIADCSFLLLIQAIRFREETGISNQQSAIANQKFNEFSELLMADR
jgi:hypothetical protein